MANESNLTVANLASVGVEELRKKWGLVSGTWHPADHRRYGRPWLRLPDDRVLDGFVGLAHDWQRHSRSDARLWLQEVERVLHRLVDWNPIRGRWIHGRR